MMEKDGVRKMVIVGHVDHGKSTLIGRLLYDTHSLSDERLREIESGGEMDFADITDQLREERQRGMTIDTAQIFFNTQKQKYVIIDTPGHVEFLKNMVTGTSQADLAVLIVDTSEGVMEQTRRHAYILNMLGLQKVIVLMNKMDSVDYSRGRFEQVKAELVSFLKSIDIEPFCILPISAIKGDNIANPSCEMSWYSGPTFLRLLDDAGFEEEGHIRPLRYPIQDVYRIRGRDVFVGRVESGVIKEGQVLVLLPEGKDVRVVSIETFDGRKRKAEEGQSIGVVLKGCSAKRGDVICQPRDLPEVKDTFEATVFWMSNEPFHIGHDIFLMCATQRLRCRVSKILRRINSSTLEKLDETSGQILHSEAAEVVIKTESPLVVDDYKRVRELGRFVLERGYDVVGAGIIKQGSK